MTVLDWLLDSDPAIRWQVLRDLVHAPAEVVAAERARVANEGWGARLLALQGEDGQWAGGACFPARYLDHADEDPGQPWTSTLPTLQLLRDFGIDPRADRVRRAVARVEIAAVGSTPASRSSRVKSSRASMAGPSPWASTSIRMSTMWSLVSWVNSSRTAGGTARRRTVPSARRSRPRSTSSKDSRPHERRDRRLCGIHRGAATRRRIPSSSEALFRRKSTGEVVNPAWLQFSFPIRWQYDVLRALDYFRSVGDAPDPRMDEAIELLRSKQQPDGRWLLENTHPGKIHFSLEDGDGRPSRWNTLRAMRASDPGATSPRRDPH